MQILLCCLSLLLLGISPAFAATAEIKTLKCTFDQDGIITHWNDDGTIKVEKGKYAASPAGMVLMFTRIDTAKRKAVVVGEKATAEVALVNSQAILSFFQITPGGNQILVSVYTGTPLKNKTFPAVISRHQVEHKPLVSQYYGSCID
jgi:hypothetical protein